MASQHVVGDSPFLKRVLIPFWVIRITIMLIYAALYIAALAAIGAFSDEINDALEEEGYSRSNMGAVIGVVVVVLVIVLVCLILDILCIIKRSRRTLSPRFFLITNIIQTTVWVVLMGLSLASAAGGAANIIIPLIILASFVGLLIYASVIFHKSRKGTLNTRSAPAGVGMEPYSQPPAYPTYNNQQKSSYDHGEAPAGYNMNNYRQA
jgi:phage-related holin